MQNMIFSADTAAYSPDSFFRFKDCHRIIFVHGGKAKAEVEGKKYLLKSGTLLLISRFEFFSVTPLTSDFRYTLLCVSPDVIKSETDSDIYSVLYNRPEGFCHAIGTDEEAPQVESMLTEAVDEFTRKPPFYENICASILEKLLVMIYRSLPELFGAPDLEFSSVVRKVQLKLENEYETDINIADLCEDFNISTSHLAHLYKKQTGYSVMENLMALRITASKRMLAETELSVSEIIEACGFHDASNFSRMFKSTTGYTPSEFRRQNND